MSVLVRPQETGPHGIFKHKNITTKNRKRSLQHMRASILRRRYLWKDKNGKVLETERQMFQRVARHVAGAEKTYGTRGAQIKALEDEFYRLMMGGKFLPNSPTLINAGRKDGMLSACFTLAIEDSIDAIFDAVKYAALIQKAGGVLDSLSTDFALQVISSDPAAVRPLGLSVSRESMPKEQTRSSKGPSAAAPIWA